VTGTADGDTIKAIKKFQFSLGSRNPDGRVDAGGRTWRALSGGNVAVINDTEMAELVQAPKTEALLASIHQSEGGYVDDPQDPGGKTKLGIAEHGEWPVFAAMFGLDPRDTSQIRNITEDQADEYYIRTRFVGLSITDIKSSKVSNALFDQSVLTPGIVKRSMRRGLNDLGNSFPNNSNDGFTSEEVEAINNANEDKLVEAFVKYQVQMVVQKLQQLLLEIALVLL
jgi:lysozyme family protein